MVNTTKSDSKTLTAFLRAVKAAGRDVVAVSVQRYPRADNVWLHVNAIRANFMTRQIRKQSFNFPFLPETQHVGLLHSNIDLGQNDVQIKNTYGSTDIQFLVSRLSSGSAQAKQNRVGLVEPTGKADGGRVDIDQSESSIL